MFRSVVIFTLLGLILVPDWASAIGWRFRQARQARIAARYPVARVYYPPAPIRYYPVPIVYGPPVVPVAHVVPLHTAVPVYPVVSAPAVPVVPPAAPVRNTAPNNLATPTAAPPDIPIRQAETPARPSMNATSPTPKAAEEEPGNKLPPLNLPMTNPAKETTPTETPPKLNLPPVSDTPKLTIPPISDTPKIELPPITAKSEPSNFPLPPLVMPTEVKYRPTLDDRPQIDVLPVDGDPPAGAVWKVGFYNYTGRDLELRVEGRTVTLPARSYVTARVPGTFTWRVGRGADEKTTIPPTSGGVEIVLK